jgi:hypothetical protein
MVGPPVAGRIRRSAGASQQDAAASGLWVQHRPDGRVATEVVGQGLEHGVIGAADELPVVGGDAVEGAVAKPDGAVGLVVGFVAAGGQRPPERGDGLAGVAVGLGVAGRLGTDLGAEGGGGALERGLGGAGGIGLHGAGQQLGQGGVVAGGQAELDLLGGSPRRRYRGSSRPSSTSLSRW